MNNTLFYEISSARGQSLNELGNQIACKQASETNAYEYALLLITASGFVNPNGAASWIIGKCVLSDCEQDVF